MGKSRNSDHIDSNAVSDLDKDIGNDSQKSPGNSMEPEFLTPYDLYRRWSKAISTKTLANWRSLGIGPPYSKLRGRVVYRSHDVLTWENQHRFVTRM